MPKLRLFPTFPWLLFALVVSSVTNASGAEYATVYVTHGAAGTTSVSRVAAMDCITLTALTAAVEQRLQRPLFVPENRADLLVTIGFGHAQGQWFADIDLYNSARQPLGRRRLVSNAPECSGLDDSLALVLALMVDLTKEEAKSEVPPPATAPVPDTTEVRVSPPEAASPTWKAVLSLSGVTSLGQVPGLGTGLEFATELRSRSAFSLELAMSAWMPKQLDDGDARVSFAHYGATAAACWFAARQGSSDMQLCGGPALGLDRATGTGYLENHTAQMVSLAPFVRGQSTFWPLPRLGVRLALGALVPVVRRDFYVTRADGAQSSLFEHPAVVPFLSLGLSLAL